MKAKIVAVLMAVGLGVTGVAMTSQAAGAGTANVTSDKDCKHETLNYFESFQSAYFFSKTDHMSVYRTGYECSKCGKEFMITERERLEGHDYEQTYYHDGSVKSECTDCHDTYYW